MPAESAGRRPGVGGPPVGPRPTLEPALQLPVPQGILFTTPSPSAGPELLELLEASLQSTGPSPALLPSTPASCCSPRSRPCHRGQRRPASFSPPLNSSFGSDTCPLSTGVLLSNLWLSLQLAPGPVPIFRGISDDTEVDVLKLEPRDSAAATVMTHALLSHLAKPQTPDQQGPTESPRARARDPAPGGSPHRARPCLQCPQWLLPLPGVLRWGSVWQGGQSRGSQGSAPWRQGHSSNGVHKERAHYVPNAGSLLA